VHFHVGPREKKGFIAMIRRNQEKKKGKREEEQSPD